MLVDRESERNEEKEAEERQRGKIKGFLIKKKSKNISLTKEFYMHTVGAVRA